MADVKAMKPEDIVSMRGVGGATISPDGRWVAFGRSVVVLDEEKSQRRSHIWLVSTKGGAPIQLTNGPNGDGGPQWSPEGERIAFTSKRDGDKQQIWVIRIAGGEARQLTYSREGAVNPRWAPDGQRIAFLRQEEEGKEKEKRKKAKDDPIVVGKDDFKQMHLWVVDIATMDEEPEPLFALSEEERDEGDDREDKRDRSERLTEGDFCVGDPQWSPDGKQIAFVSSPTPKADDEMFNSTIRIVDVATREIRKLTTYEDGEKSPRWSPDGKEIAFLHCPIGYGQKELYVIPAEGGASLHLTLEFDRNADTPVWSPNGKTIYFGAMDRARRHLCAVPREGGEVRQITEGDAVYGGMSIAEDGDMFVCYGSAPDRSGDLWVGAVDTGDVRRITEMNPQIAEFGLGAVSVVGWESDDGMKVEGVLCLPVGYREGERCPLLLDLHGGPHGGARDLEFKPVWQYFSGEGFAIFAPNFRGSDGYGREFARANNADWGGGDYRDIMAGVDRLIEQGIVDPDRMVVGGWSYGGYMTSWVVTQTDRFKAAMVGCGVTNLVSMYGQTDIPTFMRLYFRDGPPQELELYRAHSPMSYVRQAKTPTLIMHGIEDKRVPLPQGEEFYAALKAAGVETEFVKYPREGHGIGEPRHWMDVLKRQMAWFKKYTALEE